MAVSALCSRAHMRPFSAASPPRACRPASVRTGPSRLSMPAQPRPATLSSPFRPQQQQRGMACQGLFGLGLPEVVVIVGVTALIFGPSKLPELGKGLGKTVKSFQTAAKEFETELKAATADDGDAAKPAEPAKDAAAAPKKE